jgi:hypothetical protein
MFVVINTGTHACIVLISNLEANMNRLSQFHCDVLLVLNIIFVCNEHFKHLSPRGTASFF